MEAAVSNLSARMAALETDNQQLRQDVATAKAETSTVSTAALTALAAATSPTTPTAKFDNRVTKQPDRFNGQNENWSDWAFQFSGYLSAVDPRMI
jgi:hypothetical protein